MKLLAPLVVTAIFALGLFCIERYMQCLNLIHTQLPKSERFQLWLLRLAGIWLIFWTLFPVVVRSQTDLTTQVVINGQRLNSVEDRLRSIEALSIDRRLAVVEEMRIQVATMQQWSLGILGGVAVMVINQVLSLVGRLRRGERIP